MGLVRRALWYSAVCSVALACAAESQAYARMPERAGPSRSVADEDVGPLTRTLTNADVGYSLTYPRHWAVTGRVIATEFAARAACQSVRVVDFSPPANAGPSIERLQSFVQICWQRVDGSSLHEFMRETYRGRLTDLFERTSLAATPAYRTKENGESTTYFLQTAKHRVQIVSAVAAKPARRAVRRAQVARILASLSFRR